MKIVESQIGVALVSLCLLPLDQVLIERSSPPPVLLLGLLFLRLPLCLDLGVFCSRRYFYRFINKFLYVSFFKFLILHMNKFEISIINKLLRWAPNFLEAIFWHKAHGTKEWAQRANFHRNISCNRVVCKNLIARTQIVSRNWSLALIYNAKKHYHSIFGHKFVQKFNGYWFWMFSIWKFIVYLMLKAFSVQLCGCFVWCEGLWFSGSLTDQKVVFIWCCQTRQKYRFVKSILWSGLPYFRAPCGRPDLLYRQGPGGGYHMVQVVDCVRLGCRGRITTLW
jgi:hypothetical protein